METKLDKLKYPQAALTELLQKQVDLDKRQTNIKNLQNELADATTISQKARAKARDLANQLADHYICGSQKASSR